MHLSTRGRTMKVTKAKRTSRCKLAFFASFSTLLLSVIAINLQYHTASQDPQISIVSNSLFPDASHRKRAIFYNIFVPKEGDRSHALLAIQEQLKEIKKSSVLADAPIFYNLIGYNCSDNIQETCGLRCQQIQYMEEGGEDQTLQLVYEYCITNPSAQVTYIHDKGSFHPSAGQEDLRTLYTKATLSDECQNFPLDHCNVCSARFTPLPHFHTSGNMWTAHCKYVKELQPPHLYIAKMEEFIGFLTSEESIGDFLKIQHPGIIHRLFMFLSIYPTVMLLEDPDAARGRYAMEHWVHSHPMVKPCDVYPDPYFWSFTPQYPHKTDLWLPDLKAAPRYPLSVFDSHDGMAMKSLFFCGERQVLEYKFMYDKKIETGSWQEEYFREARTYCKKGEDMTLGFLVGHVSSR